MKAFPSSTQSKVWEDGMDLRDYFAAKAMQGILKAPEHLKGEVQTICQISYIYADEMMEARKK
jgi:hypothetical protein